MLTNVFLYNYSRWTKIDLDEIIYNLRKIFSNLFLTKVKKNDTRFSTSNFSQIEIDFQYFQSKCVIKNIKDQLDINKILPFRKGIKNEFTINPNNINKQLYFQNKLAKEFSFEENIVMYDGIILQKLYQEILGKIGLEFNLSELYIIIIDDLIGSFDEIDWKYHARSIICGNPTLISTSGLIYGLAKPKDYYLKLICYYRVPQILKTLKKEYRGRCIENNDERINSIVEGLAIQSIYYFIKGDSFCDDPTCRLFNSHWQEEILRLNFNKIFCKKHLDIIRKL